MQPVLFDSSIYISALRTGNEAGLTLKRLTADAPVWLSSVVLEELYAGASTGLGTPWSDWSVTSTVLSASWCRISVTGRKRVGCLPNWGQSTIMSKLAADG